MDWILLIFGFFAGLGVFFIALVIYLFIKARRETKRAGKKIVAKRIGDVIYLIDNELGVEYIIDREGVERR